MEDFCTLTPKGELYLQEIERENPVLYAKLGERVLEAIRTGRPWQSRRSLKKD